MEQGSGDYSTKLRLKDLLLQSKQLLNIGGHEVCSSSLSSDDEDNLTSFISRNQLSAKDASVLFSIASRVLALGDLTSSSREECNSLLEPVLLEAFREQSQSLQSEDEIKELMKQLAPTLNLSKAEIKWLNDLRIGHH